MKDLKSAILFRERKKNNLDFRAKIQRFKSQSIELKMKDEIGGSCPWKGCEFVFDLFTETCWSWFIAWSSSWCAKVQCLRPWSWTENSRTHSSGLYWYPCSQNTDLNPPKIKDHVHVNLRLTIGSLFLFSDFYLTTWVQHIPTTDGSFLAFCR